MGLEDYLSYNPHRDWVLKYLADSLWYPGDLSLVRKVASAVYEELSSIGSLYRAEVERDGWEWVERRLISYWRRDLSKYKNPDEVARGEINGLNNQVLRIVKGIFPYVSHFSSPSAAAMRAEQTDAPIEFSVTPEKRPWKLAAAVAASATLLIVVIYIAFSQWLPAAPIQEAVPDTSPPAILYTGPPDGSHAMNPVKITARYSDDRTVNISSVKIFVNGSEVIPTKVTLSEVEYTAVLPLGRCEVRLVLRDLSNNTASASWSFTVSSTLRTVTYSVLEEINSARQGLGLPPVAASLEYFAADYRAQDMLAGGYFNHYDLSGRLPNYYYTLMGGTCCIEENIGYTYFPPLNADRALNSSMELVRDMIYDDASSNWGHRDSLLDPTNNRAEVGLAWNGSCLFLVVHMVKDWVSWSNPPNFSGGFFSCTGNLTMNGSTLKSVVIYYSDPSEHHDFSYSSSLRVLVGEASYSLGSLVAGVAPPPMSYFGVETIRPTSWSVSGQSFSVAFNASGLRSIAGPGLYTLVLYASNTMGVHHPYDPERYSGEIPVLSYTILVG
ncbi:MAG: CAP domain-containing protein [Nitrososphaeria archaeon]|nr:CAP domain-containing protein [Nitrososphaeria archaeon]